MLAEFQRSKLAFRLRHPTDGGNENLRSTAEEVVKAQRQLANARADVAKSRREIDEALSKADAAEDELDRKKLKDVDSRIKIGLGVVDIKVNHVETPEEIAGRIERAEKILGPGRVGWIHPDCGFWMLKRSIADRKIAALPKGRDLYEGR